MGNDLSRGLERLDVAVGREPSAAGAVPVTCHLTGSLPLPCSRRMQMANGNGERVGGIFRFRNLVEIQKASDHLLYLVLLGSPISDDRRLDRERRVLRNFQSGICGGQHGDTAHLSQFQS